VRLRRGDPDASALGFVAAVALDEVLRAYAPDAAFQIKWPNDVLALSPPISPSPPLLKGRGFKVAGILLERAGEAVVIGIGVNLASHPLGLSRATTSIAALTGSAPDPEAFLDHLAGAIARWIARWRGEGLGAVLTQWQARAHPRGTALSVSLPDGETLDGLYDGLDASGALRLRLADGAARAIHAGDVFLV
jgi:BirA family biotin operon repressor/biotin-[acetyl-CoA-carboxylase] ligase